MPEAVQVRYPEEKLVAALGSIAVPDKTPWGTGTKTKHWIEEWMAAQGVVEMDMGKPIARKRFENSRAVAVLRAIASLAASRELRRNPGNCSFKERAE